MLKLFYKFCELHGGREYRLMLVGLCTVTGLIALLAPHLTFECTTVGFITNLLWIYGK